jgi:uncharacterized coiled-coil DUF342 family protein
MDPKVLLKQMIEFNKTLLDNSFSTMVSLQEQTERMVRAMLEQATWLPAEGTKAINEWVISYKKGRDDFKTLVDKSFKKVEDFFASAS